MDKIIIEISRDDDGFLAEIPQFKVFSHNNNLYGAIARVNAGLTNLIKDLEEDDQLSDDWLKRKQRLLNFVNNKKEG